MTSDDPIAKPAGVPPKKGRLGRAWARFGSLGRSIFIVLNALEALIAVFVLLLALVALVLAVVRT